MNHSITKTIIIFASVLLLMAMSLSAGTLEKRSRIELKAFMRNQTSDVSTRIGIGGVETSVNTGGVGGAVSFSYWIKENLAAYVSVGHMAFGLETNIDYLGVSTNFIGVSPVLMGIRYYFPNSALESSWRPYLSAATGPIWGSQSKTEVGIEVAYESKTMMAFGGQIGGGFDIILSRHFMLGLSAAYNFMSDFEEPLGGQLNYGGPEFGFGVSYLFGRGVN